ACDAPVSGHGAPLLVGTRDGACHHLGRRLGRRLCRVRLDVLVGGDRLGAPRAAGSWGRESGRAQPAAPANVRFTAGGSSEPAPADEGLSPRRRPKDRPRTVDRAGLAPPILDRSGLEFQVVDEPREEGAPHGGTRPALTLAGVAFIAGLALAALLVAIGTVLVDHVAGPADLVRLGPARLFAT